MLREAGKKDVEKLREFLSRYAATMPRTALRYAIEKFDEAERKRWLAFGK
jgi:3-methyladenine DNA glycosylase AlkD